MTTSLPNHGPSARRHEDSPDEARLRGLTRQQLADRLSWLSWYQPGIFTALMDYMEFSDDLAADTGPGYGEEPVPGWRSGGRSAFQSAGAALGTISAMGTPRGSVP